MKKHIFIISILILSGICFILTLPGCNPISPSGINASSGNTSSLPPTPTPTPPSLLIPVTPLFNPLATPVWSAPVSSYDYGDLCQEGGDQDLNNYLAGMEVKITNAASPVFIGGIFYNIPYGNVLMGIYTDSGNNTTPLTLLAETAPFIPAITGTIYIPLTNFSGVLIAGNYWIFATSFVDTTLGCGSTWSFIYSNTPVQTACSSYYTNVIYSSSNVCCGYGTGSEYDFRNNIMPAQITWFYGTGDSFNIFLVLTNN